MARRHTTLAFATLLAGASLVTAAGAAEPAGLPERPAMTAPKEGTHVHRTNGSPVTPAAPAVPNIESSVPVTPVPMNLPDEAKASEVKGESGIGMAGLILGTVLIAAVAVGLFYVISRRSWSTSH